jgi:AcrR family transcriptional regulator
MTPKTPDEPRKRPANRGARPPMQSGGGIARIKLIDATISSLNTRGYHQTSTVVVTKDAGLSRGTLLHYFPSKADLMLAVGAEISRRRRDPYDEALAAEPDPRKRFALLIPMLWASFQGPIGVARIELMLGGRSDAEVREKLMDINAEVDRRSKDTVWEILEAMGATDREASDTMAQLYTSTLRGLAVDARVTRVPDDIERAVKLLEVKIMEELDRLVSGGRATLD